MLSTSLQKTAGAEAFDVAIPDLNLDQPDIPVPAGPECPNRHVPKKVKLSSGKKVTAIEAHLLYAARVYEPLPRGGELTLPEWVCFILISIQYIVSADRQSYAFDQVHKSMRTFMSQPWPQNV